MSGYHAIKERWIEFAKSSAPEGTERFARAEPFDAMTAAVSGAVATYIGEKGRLGSDGRASLRSAVEALEAAAKEELDGPGRAYVGKMLSIARAVLNTPDRPVKCGG